MSESKLPQLSRRHLFAGAGTAGALAAAAAALPMIKSNPVAVAAATPVPDAAGGYQVTPHVLRYYQTTRV